MILFKFFIINEFSKQSSNRWQIHENSDFLSGSMRSDVRTIHQKTISKVSHNNYTNFPRIFRSIVLLFSGCLLISCQSHFGSYFKKITWRWNFKFIAHVKWAQLNNWIPSPSHHFHGWYQKCATFWISNHYENIFPKLSSYLQFAAARRIEFEMKISFFNASQLFVNFPR